MQFVPNPSYTYIYHMNKLIRIGQVTDQTFVKFIWATFLTNYLGLAFFSATQANI